MEPGTDNDPRPSRLMRALVSAALVMPFVLVGLAWAWGTRLPAERRLHFETAVAAPPATILTLLRVPERQPSWWPRVERIEPLESATGVRQVFTDGRSAHLTISPPRGEAPAGTVEWSIADPAGPYRGTWRFAVIADASGSRVVLDEEASLGNPFARLLVVWRGGGGGLAEDCLGALAAWAGAQPGGGG